MWGYEVELFDGSVVEIMGVDLEDACAAYDIYPDEIAEVLDSWLIDGYMM